ncbi:hypothetical protein BU14_0516s0006, partial [Porphyra umbilicalis]
ALVAPRRPPCFARPAPPAPPAHPSWTSRHQVARAMRAHPRWGSSPPMRPPANGQPAGDGRSPRPVGRLTAGGQPPPPTCPCIPPAAVAHPWPLPPPVGVPPAAPAFLPLPAVCRRRAPAPPPKCRCLVPAPAQLPVSGAQLPPLPTLRRRRAAAGLARAAAGNHEAGGGRRAPAAAPCAGAPRAPVRFQRRCASSFPRARAPRSTVHRCAPSAASSAGAPRAPRALARPGAKCAGVRQAPVRPEFPSAVTPRLPVRPKRGCAPSASRASTPGGTVRRCAPSACVSRRPGRRPSVSVRRKRRCAPSAVRPKRPCAPSAPRAGVSVGCKRRCVGAACAPRSHAHPRSRLRAPPPCTAAPVRPACCFHCALRVQVPPSADASFPALPSAPPRMKVRPCAPGNRAPRAPVHPCARCTDAPHAVPPTRAGGGWALTPRRPRRPLPPAVPHPAAAPTRSASPSAPLPRPALASRTQPRKRGALATCHPHRSLGSSPAVTATAGGPLFLYTGPATHVSVAGGGDGESKCRQMRPTCSVLVVAAVLALPADHSRYPNFFDRA